MRSVPLQPGLEGCQRAFLRPLTGADEMAAAQGMVTLLDRVLVAAGADAVKSGEAARLAVCDRDRLLAAVQRELFGDRIDADARCGSCEMDFTLAFSLAALIDARAPEVPEGVDGPDDAGFYSLAGIRFRLPCSRDLMRVAGLPAEAAQAALLDACIIQGDAGVCADDVDAAMARLGPTLNTDLEATCPHCSSLQTVRFNIADFLARQLANERPFLVREVHEIACAYGWAHDTIMALPRQERHDYVRLIAAQGASRHTGRHPTAARA